jgi:hypothetical protein
MFQLQVSLLSKPRWPATAPCTLHPLGRASSAPPPLPQQVCAMQSSPGCYSCQRYRQAFASLRPTYTTDLLTPADISPNTAWRLQQRRRTDASVVQAQRLGRRKAAPWRGQVAA